MAKPNYSDDLVQDILNNALIKLQDTEDGSPEEDSVQCVVMLAEDLIAARKRIKELEKNAS